jgi:hypothetical protein
LFLIGTGAKRPSFLCRIGDSFPDLVKDRYVVPNHRAFAAYDEAHCDALGFVVMGLVEQVDCAQPGAESEGRAYGFSRGAASYERTHERIGLTVTLTQASLRRKSIRGDQSRERAETHLVLEGPKWAMAGRVGNGAGAGYEILTLSDCTYQKY